MDNATPAMKQYLQIKQDNKDSLVLYRMGDFYELFFDDAITTAKVLNITLTKRGFHNDKPIPMCGIPFHALDNYLPRLIKEGYKVALCEQVETPEMAKLRGNNAVVKREVTKVITPGTILEDNLIKDSYNNFLCTVCQDDENQNNFIVAYADISTGSFFVEQTQNIESFLQRISASEIVISESLKNLEIVQPIVDNLKKITVLPDFKFNKKNNMIVFQENFGIYDFTSVGDFTLEEINAAGVLIDYIKLTSKLEKVELKNLSKNVSDKALKIDFNTWKNLEITQSLTGEKKASLFYCVNTTKTNIGSRYLSQMFANPICDIDELNLRFAKQQFFIDNYDLTLKIEKELHQIPDFERAISRILYNRGGPRDLDVIKNTLNILPKICLVLTEIDFEFNQFLSEYNMSDFCLSFNNLKDKLESALMDELPLLARDGGFIKTGYSSALDEYKNVAINANQYLENLQEKYKKESGSISLKIKNNNILGYYIEVPSKQADYLLDQKNGFIHRQTLINGVRFTTNELFELQTKIESANSKILGLELEIFEDLINDIKVHSKALYELCNKLASLDVFTSLSVNARQNNFCKPEINESNELIIENGRHLVVEHFLKKELKDFIPNDCVMKDMDKINSRIWLLTGPNMAGKSTYLRANALIVFMAHVGLFVPASHAVIGIVDKIFSRIGASDNLSKGQSTFMNEMIETAAILNQATPKSFVILDEIGRGTSTYDGLAIASAVLQYIHNVNNCRTLFATHYHELTSLTNSLANLSNHTMEIKEYNHEVIFMHKIKEGRADKSYGIWVAKLAGIPSIVINNAKAICEKLEKNKDEADLPLFNNIEENSKEEIRIPSEVEEKLQSIDLDTLTPMAAMQFLYELKKKI